MQKSQGFAHDRSAADQIGGATITVYQAGTIALATLYADDALTPLANPFTADTDGYWFFYAADGTYDIRFSGTVSPAWTMGGVTLYGIPGSAPSYSFPTSTRANLGTPTTGVAKLLTDDARNLAIGMGSQYFDVDGRVFSVRAYGATGDGTTNDTTAIQAAITAAAAVGAEVYFPPGTYKITDKLTLSATSRLRGAGPNQSVITTHNLWAVAGDPLLCFSGAPGNEYQALSIQSLGLGLSNDAAFNACIDLTYTLPGMLRLSDLVCLNASTYQVGVVGPVAAGVISRTYVSGNTGMYLLPQPSADRASSLVVKDCTFSGCPGFGLDYEGSNSPGVFEVAGCSFDQCGTAGTAASGAIRVNPDADAVVRGSLVSIHDTYITDCDGGAGVELTTPGNTGARVVLERVLVQGGTRTYGVHASNATVACRIDLKDCTIAGAGTTDIYLRTSPYGTIFGCVAGTTSLPTKFLVFPDPTDSTINRSYTQNTELLSPSAAALANLGVGDAPNYAGGQRVQFGELTGADVNSTTLFGWMAACAAAAADLGTGLKLEVRSNTAGGAQYVRFTATFRDNAGGTGAGADRCVLSFDKAGGADTTSVTFTVTSALGATRTPLQLDHAPAANDLALLVYSQVAGALVRLSTGAADSAGPGYRAVRIPN